MKTLPPLYTGLLLASLFSPAAFAQAQAQFKQGVGLQAFEQMAMALLCSAMAEHQPLAALRVKTLPPLYTGLLLASLFSPAAFAQAPTDRKSVV